MSEKLNKIKKEKIGELREIIKEKTNRQSFDNELTIISRLSDRPDIIHAYVIAARKMINGDINISDSLDSWLETNYLNESYFSYEEITFIILSELINVEELNSANELYFNHLDDDFTDYIVIDCHSSDGWNPIPDLIAILNSGSYSDLFNKTYKDNLNRDFEALAYVRAAKDIERQNIDIGDELEEWLNWNLDDNEDPICPGNIAYIIATVFAPEKYHKYIQNKLEVNDEFVNMLTNDDKNDKKGGVENGYLIREFQKILNEEDNNKVFYSDIDDNDDVVVLSERYIITSERMLDLDIEVSESFQKWIEVNYEYDTVFSYELIQYFIVYEYASVSTMEEIEEDNNFDFSDEIKDFVKNNNGGDEVEHCAGGNPIEEKGGNLIPDNKKILVGRKPLEDLQLILKNDEESKDSFTKGVNALLLKEMDITQMYIDSAREVETYNRVISDELRNWINWNFNESDNPLLDDEIVYMICLGFTDLKDYAGLVNIIEEQLNLREEFLNEYKLLIKKGESFMGKLKETATKVGNKAKKAAGKSKDETKLALVYSGKVKAGNLAIQNIKKAAFSMLFPMLADSNINIDEDNFMKSSVIDVIIGQSVGYLMNIADGENKTTEILNLISSCMIMASTQNAIEALQIEKIIGVLTEGIDIEKLKDLSI
jgi:hypothetical protein